jgi:predicted nucleic acid-binding protein
VSRIFWDTNLYIYLLEGQGAAAKRVTALREAMLSRGDQLITSTLTLGEVLVKPLEKEEWELARKYEEAIVATSLLIPLDTKAAKVYARLRGERTLRAADAMQLACAASAGVDLFITNDARLQTKRVEGVQFIVSLERAPL